MQFAQCSALYLSQRKRAKKRWEQDTSWFTMVPSKETHIFFFLINDSCNPPPQKKTNSNYNSFQTKWVPWSVSAVWLGTRGRSDITKFPSRWHFHGLWTTHLPSVYFSPQISSHTGLILESSFIHPGPRYKHLKLPRPFSSSRTMLPACLIFLHCCCSPTVEWRLLSFLNGKNWVRRVTVWWQRRFGRLVLKLPSRDKMKFSLGCMLHNHMAKFYTRYAL